MLCIATPVRLFSNHDELFLGSSDHIVLDPGYSLVRSWAEVMRKPTLEHSFNCCGRVPFTKSLDLVRFQPRLHTDTDVTPDGTLWGATTIPPPLEARGPG